MAGFAVVVPSTGWVFSLLKERDRQNGLNDFVTMTDYS